MGVPQLASISARVERGPDKSTVLGLRRKCRRAVAGVENVLPHERGGGQSAFDWKKRSKVRVTGIVVKSPSI